MRKPKPKHYVEFLESLKILSGFPCIQNKLPSGVVCIPKPLFKTKFYSNLTTLLGRTFGGGIT